MKKRMRFEADTAIEKDKPQPISPRGVSSRLPFLLFLAVIVLLFTGYRYVTDSSMYRTAEAFVRRNAEIRNAVGAVRECRLWFPVKIDFPDGRFHVRVTLRVEGDVNDTLVYVALESEGEVWRVVDASYKDRQGSIRPLVKNEKPAGKNVTNEQPGRKQTKTAVKLAAALKEIKKGQRLFREKNYEKAVAAYDRAIQLAPENIDAFYWRGRAFAEMDRIDRALADMESVVASSPKNVYAWRWIGYLQAKKNHFDDCIASLTKAVELKPDHGWTLYNRGRCYYRKGDRAKAVEDAKRACSVGFEEGCRIYKRLNGEK